MKRHTYLFIGEHVVRFFLLLCLALQRGGLRGLILKRNNSNKKKSEHLHREKRWTKEELKSWCAKIKATQPTAADVSVYGGVRKRVYMWHKRMHACVRVCVRACACVCACVGVRIRANMCVRICALTRCAISGDGFRSGARIEGKSGAISRFVMVSDEYIRSE